MLRHRKTATSIKNVGLVLSTSQESTRQRTCTKLGLRRTSLPFQLYMKNELLSSDCLVASSPMDVSRYQLTYPLLLKNPHFAWGTISRYIDHASIFKVASHQKFHLASVRFFHSIPSWLAFAPCHSLWVFPCAIVHAHLLTRATFCFASHWLPLKSISSFGIPLRGLKRKTTKSTWKGMVKFLYVCQNYVNAPSRLYSSKVLKSAIG